MNPNRWREIEALFDECSALDPAERVAWLEAQGARDPELRREVEALLGYDEPSERLERIVQRSQEEVFLAGEERPGAGSSSGLGLVGARGGDGLGPGDTVGAYRLERRLGEGGMGTVWLAHRDDDEFEQRVALKLVGSGGEARGWVERFRTERQILAGLEHPHIARLLDGGSTEGGQPFLVMEYVDGEELLAYCDRRKLGIHPRLELFLQVLGAVEHAHRNLVVHRDLKPANILVHAESGPKLLDFGIAKILDPEPAGGLDGRLRADPTLPQERLLTPDYASPEQILGGAVTTASDLYSLGVVLFELLTGRRPRRLQGLGPVAVERELTERPPSRPSTVARSATGPGAGRGLGLAEAETNAGDLAELRGLSARQLARQLRGDLDTVVVKALQTDPARRYRSVAELADDLERHLGGRPVRARPDSWHYRAGKLLRRHPWGVAATVAIAGLLVAFVVNLVLQSERLRSERDRARAAEAEARGVSEFLLDIF
ncbi:MAG: serine/threonine protein kinase, partial [Acidobacteria bacterium]|nr:serine/threonine protein kinase [Acidobacteriota bacterium]